MAANSFYDLEEVKRLHEEAYDYSQTTRERASDDLVFTWVTQWSGDLLENSTLEYKGQFDVLRKAIRHIISELGENPVSIQFHPVDLENDDEIADIMEGMYLTDERDNASIEAKENAAREAVVTGFGAYAIYTDYQMKRTGKKDQKIMRQPLFEACNRVFFDPNAKLMDKSDADYVSVLTAYSEDGYKKLKSRLTKTPLDEVIIDADFAAPYHSYSFPWVTFGSTRTIYVVEFYYRELIDDQLLHLLDQNGGQTEVLAGDFEDYMEELDAAGYEIIDSEDVERYQIKKIIASGEDSLSEDIINGHLLPVVPIYGEHQIIEGEEHFEGVTRSAKDPQRLHNFHLSYLADIVSRSPRQKPIFFPEQIKGHEHMYNETGADNHLPYLYQNMVSLSTGEMLPGGPAGELPEQKMPDALLASIDASRQAIEDVANPGVPQDLSDIDLSGKAVHKLTSRLDQQALLYQQNYKHAQRRDAEIYTSMATAVYNFPQDVILTKQDGTQSNMKLMDSVMDEETGKTKMINDISHVEFAVFASIGASFSSKREQTLESLTEMMSTVSPDHPVYQILLLKTLELMDGVNFDDIRDYARKELILMGVKQPETDEEKQLLQEAQQKDDNQPQMLIAQADMLRAQAEDKTANIKAEEAMGNLQLKHEANQIQAYKAETERQKAMADAKEAGMGNVIKMKQVQLSGQNKITGSKNAK